MRASVSKQYANRGRYRDIRDLRLRCRHASQTPPSRQLYVALPGAASSKYGILTSPSEKRVSSSGEQVLEQKRPRASRQLSTAAALRIDDLDVALPALDGELAVAAAVSTQQILSGFVRARPQHRLGPAGGARTILGGHPRAQLAVFPGHRRSTVPFPVPGRCSWSIASKRSIPSMEWQRSRGTAVSSGKRACPLADDLGFGKMGVPV